MPHGSEKQNEVPRDILLRVYQRGERGKKALLMSSDYKCKLLSRRPQKQESIFPPPSAPFYESICLWVLIL